MQTNVVKGILVFLLSASLVGCGIIYRVPTDYSGSDSGKVVLGMGAAKGTVYHHYSLIFRKREGTNVNGPAREGVFTYYQAALFRTQDPDYRSDAESGVVLVQSLPPGDYEIFNFNISFAHATGVTDYSSKTNISIPFSVKPGETTYLGNYQANRLFGRNFLGLPWPAGGVFVVSNRFSDDLKIAQVKMNVPLGTSIDATPDPDSLGNPFFVDSKQITGSK